MSEVLKGASDMMGGLRPSRGLPDVFDILNGPLCSSVECDNFEQQCGHRAVVPGQDVPQNVHRKQQC